MLITGHYPKATFVHFIEKPDDKDVRPVVLRSCPCNLHETPYNRLQW